MAFRRRGAQRSTRRMRGSRTSFKRRSVRKRTRGFGRGRKRIAIKRSPTERVVPFQIEIRRPIQFAANAAGVADIVVDTTSTFPGYGNVGFSLLDIPSEKRVAWEDLYREVKLAGVRVQWMPPGQQTNMTVPWSDAGTPVNAILPAQRATMYWLRTNQLDQTSYTPLVAESADTLLQYGEVRKWISASKIKSTFLKGLVMQSEFAETTETTPSVSSVAKTYKKGPWINTTIAATGGTPAVPIAPRIRGFTYAFDSFGQGVGVFNISGNVDSTVDPLDVTRECNYGHFVFTYYVLCRKSRPIVASV